jgi:hypothetical protein
VRRSPRIEGQEDRQPTGGADLDTLPSLSFSTDISSLELPHVVEMHLRGNGIDTVQCLCLLTENDLHDLRNVGNVSVRAVYSALKARGLRLAPWQGHTEFAHACQRAVDGLGGLGTLLAAADDLLRRIEERRFLFQNENLLPVFEAALSLQHAIVAEEIARDRLEKVDLVSAGRQVDDRRMRTGRSAPAVGSRGPEEGAPEVAGAIGEEKGFESLPSRIRLLLATLPSSTRERVTRRLCPTPRSVEPWFHFLASVSAQCEVEREGEPGSAPPQQPELDPKP